MMKSLKVPLIGQFVIVFVLLPNSTGWTPPIGSTIASLILAAAGLPPTVTCTV